MPSDTQRLAVSKTSLWAGRIISTLVVLFLLFDAVAKLMRSLLSSRHSPS